MKKIHFGTFNKGKLVPDNIEEFKTHCGHLEGKRVQVTIEPYKKGRSLDQNRYYWKVIIGMIADSTGLRKDEHEGLHDSLRVKFLKEPRGSIAIIKSTSELTTTEFEEYMSQIRIWASDFLGIYIPEPNEVNYGTN